MKEGLVNEEMVIKEYVHMKHNEGHENLYVEKCGFFVSKTHGFLGASPDGLVTDPTTDDINGLVEGKFLQLNENESLEDALVRKAICKKTDVSVTMNRNHKYFYQVQQQMFVTNRKWTDFVVKGSCCDGIYCERVPFNQSTWETVLHKLDSFYSCWIVPELAYPKIKFALDKFDLRAL